MPENWADHEGWERYYSSLYPAGDFEGRSSNTGSIALRDIGRFASELRNAKAETVWIPGCGVSLLPKVLSQLGFDVFATDISPTAIEFQTSDDPRIQNLVAKALSSESIVDGRLVVEVHDLAKIYRSDYFDLVLNVKAIQGFDSDAITLIASSHYTALKPGKQAIFDTMNVQGDRRNNLEAALVDAGFVVPFFELNRWYRSELDKTGLPYVFVLGNPIIPWHGDYAENESKRDADMEILRSITTKFYERQQADLEAENEKLRDPAAKIATVIYSTG